MLRRRVKVRPCSVLADFEGVGHCLDECQAERLFESSSGVAWLSAESELAHGDRDCRSATAPSTSTTSADRLLGSETMTVRTSVQATCRSKMALSAVHRLRSQSASAVRRIDAEDDFAWRRRRTEVANAWVAPTASPRGDGKRGERLFARRASRESTNPKPRG